MPLPASLTALALGFPRITQFAVMSSAGSNAPNFPPTNLIKLPLTQVWRSLDLDPANTQVQCTFPSLRLVQIIGICKHNISLTGTYRLLLYSDTGLANLVYDSGVTDAWPVLFPRGSVQWANRHTWTGKYTLEEILGYNWHIPIILPQPLLIGSMKLLISDGANQSGQGFGYFDTPGVAIIANTGSGAVVSANVVNYQVASYTVTAPGSGYSSDAYAVVAGITGKGALAKVTLSGGTVIDVSPWNTVEIGLLEMAEMWQSSITWSVGSQGSGFGFRFRTVMNEAQSGSRYYDLRQKIRFFRGGIDMLQRDEYMTNPFEAYRQYDLATPFLMVAYPFEPVHWLRTVFPMNFKDPGQSYWSTFASNSAPIYTEEVV